MAKFEKDELYETLRNNSDEFVRKVESEMNFDSNFSGNILSLDWLDIIESTCPYIDNVVRNPKLVLINEERVEKIEKSKRITVASVKDLARHTNYISKVDSRTGDVEPSKILDIRNEETFNIYENRFLYTLLLMIDKFVTKKEKEFKDFEMSKMRTLEYKGVSRTNQEKIEIELRIKSSQDMDLSSNKKLEKDFLEAKKRIKLVRDYISSWFKSEMYKSLSKAHVPLVMPPIKKTNIILKNPNFQMAVKLWDYLQKYDNNSLDDSSDYNSNGNNIEKEFLDHAFLIDYYVLDSVSNLKREEKKKNIDYAILLLTNEIERTMNLLLDSGVDMSEDELFKLVSAELKKNKENNRLVGADDVKNKFKSAIDDYLERIQDY